jgi:hypothetical protein
MSHFVTAFFAQHSIVKFSPENREKCDLSKKADMGEVFACLSPKTPQLRSVAPQRHTKQ